MILIKTYVVRRFLEKLNIELPYNPEIPLLGIYLEKNHNSKILHLYVHCSTIYNSQDTEATKLYI